MDKRNCNEDMLDSKTGSTLSGVEKSTVTGNRSLDFEIATQTPEKITESLYNKSKEKELNLPECHKTLLGLFDCMTYSLRLLSLCKRPSTFLNICSQVEVLRKRKLSYMDLARMKYALPEALEINKILVHDLKTRQMRPELKISLLLNVVEGHQEQSDYKALHKVFAAKLMDISIEYPEDIPLANLPDPFNQNSKSGPDDKSDNSREPISKLSLGLPEAPVQRDSLDLSHQASEELDQAESSFQGPSLARYFSKRIASDEGAKYRSLVASPKYTSNASSVRLNKQHAKPELVEEFYGMGNELVNCTTLDIQNTHVDESQDADFQPSISNSPLQMKSPVTSVQSPARGIASSDILMTETPAQHTEPELVEEFCDGMGNEPVVCTTSDLQNKHVKESQDADSQPSISNSPVQMKSPVASVQSLVRGIASSDILMTETPAQHTEPELVEEFCDGMGNEPVVRTTSDLQNKHVKESQDAHSQPSISNSPVQMKSPVASVQSPVRGIASSDILMTETPAQHTEPELVEEFCDGMGNEPVVCTTSDLQNKHVKESQDAHSQPNICNSPLQMKSPVTTVQSPVLGIASSDILLTETPAQMPPRRSVSSCDEKLKGVTRLTPYSMSAKRSLVFSHREGEVSAFSELHSCRIKNDCTSQTPMTEGFAFESVGCHHLVDRNVTMNDDTVIDEFKRSSRLSELVPIIHKIFLSVNCAAITQEELVHKILVDSVHMVERREVEVHIELLEKMLPDWLCKRSAPFGGFLYCVKKGEDLSSIQARFVDT